jgi:hypothetical protein
VIYVLMLIYVIKWIVKNRVRLWIGLSGLRWEPVAIGCERGCMKGWEFLDKLSYC